MTTFHDLAHRAADLVAPSISLDVLVARGERRLRRRRIAVIAAVACAVMVVVIGGLLVNSGTRQANAPIDQPNRHETTPAPTTPSARKIVYADNLPGRVMHFGDRIVATGVAFAHIDMTDDGFVYTTGGYLGGRRLWFSDGGAPAQKASGVCQDGHGSGNAVRTANAGSLVAWFECEGSTAQTLVVFDTGIGREVLRQQLRECQWTGFAPCTLDQVIGEHVYFTDTYYRHGGTGRVAFRRWVFDLGTGTTSAPAPQSFAEDLTGHSRGLVVGDSWSTGAATDGIGQEFAVGGSRLVPQTRNSNGEQAGTSAFDTATRREMRLALPSGYRRADGFTLFEWLDDDTVALVARGDQGWPSGRGYGDILTCRLSTGQCELTVRGREVTADNQVRVVPHLGLPG
jgi:hypothetical protein